MYIWAVVCENEDGVSDYTDFFVERKNAEKHVEYLCSLQNGYMYSVTSIYVY